jgi:exopolyphosphatase/guanosine-5'-triphosphate,3'-diphosphate pyrophosphatase
MILAGIDIGTNSIRLLIAETGPDAFRELYSARRTTRLGKDLDRTGMLSSDAMARSVSALIEFSASLHRFPAAQISAIGTSALRNASNAHTFIADVRQRTGIDIIVISGEDEARLTLRGVRSALQGREGMKAGPLDSALVIDIGGGSTEFIVTNGCSGPLAQSLPLGAVYLSERYLTADPPGADALLALRQAVRSELDKAEPALLHGPGDRPHQLIGTAGTITTLAAMDLGMALYDPARINGAVLTRGALDRIVQTLVRSTAPERRTLAGLEPGREDIILSGAIIAQEIMERCAYPEMLVSDWGLREGIIADLLTKRA